MRSMSRIALGAFLLGGGATGLSAATDAAPPPIDACALLAAEEVRDVLGTAVLEGERRDRGVEPSIGAYSSACIWVVPTDEAGEPDADAPLDGRSFVILNAIRWPIGSARAGEYLEAFRSAARNGEIPATPVPRRVGDEALWWGDGLAVRRRNVSFGISVYLQSGKALPRGVAEARLADSILRRLDLQDSVKD